MKKVVHSNILLDVAVNLYDANKKFCVKSNFSVPVSMLLNILGPYEDNGKLQRLAGSNYPAVNFNKSPGYRKIQKEFKSMVAEAKADMKAFKLRKW